MANCGTLSSYNNDHCRCQPCRDAYATYQRKRRAQLRAVGVPAGVAHGTPSAISRYCCRCSVCVSAKAAYDVTRRATDGDRLRARTNAQRASRRSRVREQARRHYAENAAAVIARNLAYTATPAGRETKRRTWNRRRGVPFTPAGAAYCEVLRNDPCSYCGAAGGTIDHIVPIVSGGDGNWMNLTSACARCNASKRHESLLLFMLRSA